MELVITHFSCYLRCLYAIFSCVKFLFLTFSGQPLSLLLKQCPLIDELALYDIANTPGVTADLAHVNTPAVVHGYNGKENLNEALHQSDIVMVSAGFPRKPGMTRDDLFTSNASIVQEMGTAIAKICPQALVGLITNPLNSVTIYQ